MTDISIDYLPDADLSVAPRRILLDAGVFHGLIGSLISGYPEDWQHDDDYEPVALDFFTENFELVKNNALADPEEPWYQGVNFMVVIRHRASGALYGFPYFESISKYGEPYFDINGEAPDGTSVYIFAPVTPFTITGYALTPLDTDSKDNR